MPAEETALEALAAKVAELEERLSLLEGLDHEPALARQSVANDDNEANSDKFWALEGLKARIGQQSVVLFTGSVRPPGGPSYAWQQGSDADALLEREWDHFAGPLAALGHPVRLQLLREVLKGRQNSSELGASEGLGTSGQIYHHLRQLLSAGWLRSAGRGRYEVPPARIIPLLVILSAAEG